jgi:hypothetical protein
LGHSSNEAEAIAVSDWLTHQGWKDVFLDLDPGVQRAKFLALRVGIPGGVSKVLEALSS